MHALTIIGGGGGAGGRPGAAGLLLTPPHPSALTAHVAPKLVATQRDASGVGCHDLG